MLRGASWSCLGIWSGCLQEASLGKCFRHVHQRGDLEANPEHAGGIIFLRWSGNASGFPWHSCWKRLGSGKSGLSCKGCCLNEQTVLSSKLHPASLIVWYILAITRPISVQWVNDGLSLSVGIGWEHYPGLSPHRLVHPWATIFKLVYHNTLIWWQKKCSKINNFFS